MDKRWKRRMYIGAALLCAVALLIVLAACSSGPATTPVEKATEEVVSPTSTLKPSATPAEPTPTEPPPTEVPPTETPTPTGPSPLPPEPQRIEFQAEDGEPLVGTYYPAAVNPAPVVVLMHWAPGDQQDWVEIARWLQNRGQTSAVSGQAGLPWLDPSWFPPMPDDLSFAVFTFDFRGCTGGCAQMDQAGWLLDAIAAVETARELPGVDPDRLAAIGASIGADGAVDACGEGCLGGLSLSPGSYLNVAYDEAVEALGDEDPAKPAWCLAAEGDGQSAQACRSASGDHYWMHIHPGDAHGMLLITPDTDPDTLVVMLDFLRLVFDL